jgi:hypothetical protein
MNLVVQDDSISECVQLTHEIGYTLFILIFQLELHHKAYATMSTCEVLCFTVGKEIR